MKKLLLSTIILLSVVNIFPDDFITITIQPNQSLWSIARANNITVDRLIRYNNITDVSRIIAGTIIKIPLTNNPHTHTIQKGETMWSISRRYNIPIADILSFNNIRNEQEIREGVVLRLSADTQATNTTSYTVQRGDTLYSLSRRHGLTPSELLNINNLTAETPLRTGQVILVKPLSESLETIDIAMPLNGEIREFSSAHFKGIGIYCTGSTDIKAAATGVVSLVEIIPGYGLTVFIRSNNGIITTYASLSSANVSAGTTVTRGQVIGVSGNIRRFNRQGIVFSVYNPGKNIRYDEATGRFVVL